MVSNCNFMTRRKRIITNVIAQPSKIIKDTPTISTTIIWVLLTVIALSASSAGVNGFIQFSRRELRHQRSLYEAGLPQPPKETPVIVTQHGESRCEAPTGTEPAGLVLG